MNIDCSLMKGKSVFSCFCGLLLSNLQVEMSSVSKRDHAPPTGQTPGKKASKLRNSKKSLFQDEEPKPDVNVCMVS